MKNHCGQCCECESNFRKCSLSKIKPYEFPGFIKRYGEATFLDCLEKNENNGVVDHREGRNGDYDDFDDVEEQIRFIKSANDNLRCFSIREKA